MNRSRDFSWLVRPVAVAGLVLFGALLLGVQPSTAAPTAPVGPTGFAPPTVQTLPPKPEPCVKKCLPPTLEPCFALPGHPCTQPPTIAPCTINPDACKPPTTTTTPTTPTVITSTNPPVTPKHPGTPSDPPVPTPNRIDTGGGPAESAPTALFWVIPALAVLILVAGAGGFWLARSERRR
ncbi:MAG TPA: hypothetical protein VGR06_36125 [Actinophytocola sp.]|uniref:hypothetical protein n=1 Tax=Actinophytocola sp. TaxID=1872138 RepID=UPI002E0C7E05|nr:hypothetical protein [Actinophytocola sp.]